MLEQFVYCAWFRDHTMPSDDQDYEWPACFIVEAETSSEASAWGDRLARDFSRRRGTEQFLFSSVEPVSVAEGDLTTLPVIQFGELATDERIGW